MSDIRLGALAGKATKVTGLANISSLWKAPVLLDNGILAPNCWIKVVSLPELVLECFGHLLAREAGLPFLPPIVASDPNDLLNAKGLLFATEDAQSPSLRQLVSHYPAFQHLYFSALQTWIDSATLAVIDELLANGDRNIGNLLFDGRAKWVPIDYARCKAQGPHPMHGWDGMEIRLDHTQSNHLVEVFKVVTGVNVHPALDRVENVRLFTGVLQHFAGLPIDGAEALAQRLVVWVQDRRNWALRRLLGNRLSNVHGPNAAFVI